MKVFQVVAVYDNLSESFLQPTFVESEKEAERLFTYQINNIALWKDNASDYELYKLGEYDAEKGMLISNLHKLVKGTSVLRKEKEE